MYIHIIYIYISYYIILLYIKYVVWSFWRGDNFEVGGGGGAGGDPPLDKARSRYEEVLIKKVFHLTYKDVERSQGQCKKWLRIGKKGS